MKNPKHTITYLKCGIWQALSMCAPWCPLYYLLKLPLGTACGSSFQSLFHFLKSIYTKSFQSIGKNVLGI
ncbi:hypothetical protein MT325_m718R [Paramecium bursaria chlorella virus MT325]|uniref:Uncharacterized protein m718R n=1 Tax=Paramecium bursaria Chlorella virus MT325 TaxID=346932 RepID=A7IV98_PBCVM|nr:hypothetical protein MT325_m718R [Paramecium bursaria chlorella virus MT325]